MGIKEDICFSSGGSIYSIFEKTSTRIFENAEEIRIRSGQMLKIKMHSGYIYLSQKGEETFKNTAYKVSVKDITEMMNSLSGYSPYSYKEFMASGFITIRGGHRAGISGQGVIENGKVTAIKDISGINIRIARENKNCGKDVIKFISEGNEIKNTAIISPPAVGKTTLIRDITRRISDVGFNVSVVDERSEICALYKGMPQLDIGENTDVLDLFPKHTGILSALRSLSPDVIVCDEVGGEKDISAIEKACFCGVKIICTVHGYTVKDCKDRLGDVFKEFDTFIVIYKDDKGLRHGEVFDKNGIKRGEVNLY